MIRAAPRGNLAFIGWLGAGFELAFDCKGVFSAIDTTRPAEFEEVGASVRSIHSKSNRGLGYPQTFFKLLQFPLFFAAEFQVFPPFVKLGVA